MSRWNAIRERLGTVTASIVGAILSGVLVLTILEANHAAEHNLSFDEYLYFKVLMSPFRLAINLSCLAGLAVGFLGIVFSKKRIAAAVVTVLIGGVLLIHYKLFHRPRPADISHLIEYERNQLGENNPLVRIGQPPYTGQAEALPVEDDFITLESRFAVEADAGADLIDEQPFPLPTLLK